MKFLFAISFIFISVVTYAQNTAPPPVIIDRSPIAEDSVKKGQEIYEIVDQEPQFPGGYQKFREYLQKTIQYPKKALKDSTEGTVYVSFVVNEDGTISDAKVLKSIPELNEEAIRVMQKSPKWIPGKMNGRPVRTMMRVPITFRLK